MPSVNTEKWRIAFEVFGIIAVVVSLVLLFYEVRENTVAVRANTTQQIMDSSRQFLLDIALDEELTRITIAGREDLSNLTAIEMERFRGYMRGNWLFLQNIWIQNTLGVIDPRVWTTYEGIFCEIFAGQLGTMRLWSAEKNHGFDPEFVAHVDRCTTE